MGNFRSVRWFFLLLAVSLCGCGSLGKRVEENLNAAQLLADRCESFEQEIPDIDATQLLGRIKKRLLLACDRSGAECPFALTAELDSAKTWFGSQAPPKEVSEALGGFSRQLADFNRAVDEFSGNKQFIPLVEKRWQEMSAACRTTPNRYQCGAAQNQLLATLSRAASETNGDGKSVAATLGKSRDAWRGVTDELRNSRVGLTDTGRQSVNQIEAALQAVEISLRAMLDAGMDQFRADFFNRLLPKVAAEKVLDFTERQLEPADRLFEKADEKLYMFGSLAVEVSRADIQGYFDSFYLKYVRDKFPSTESAVAFARAACTRLSKPTPAGKSASLITPFLYSSLTLVHLEMKAKQACMNGKAGKVEIGKNPSGEQDCELVLAKIRHSAAIALVKKQAPPAPALDSLEGMLSASAATLPGSSGLALAPEFVLPPKAIPVEKIYDLCLSSERVLREQVAASGNSAVGADIRQKSQATCSEYALKEEQERYKAPAGAVSVAFDPQSKETVSKLAELSAQIEPQGTSSKANGIPEALEAKSVSSRGFCAWLRTTVRDVVCVDRANSSWVEIPGAFESGKFESASLVPALRTLSRVIEAYGTSGVAEVVVFGAASEAPVTSRALQTVLRKSAPSYPCPGPVAPGVQDRSGNKDLAHQRAKWGAGVMGRAAPQLKEKLRACPLAAEPERGDQPFDRRLALKVNWQPKDGLFRALPAAGTRSALSAHSELGR